MPEIANNGVFSQTDASNTGSLPGISGSSAPSQIDDSIRALIGAVKREHDWRNLFTTTSGSANAYVLTFSVAPAAYYTGQVFSFTANFACTGSATLNVNSLGAKTIKKDVSGTMTALSSGDIASGAKVKVVYDGTDFIWINWQGSTGTSYTVNGLTEETSADTADMLGGYDTSGTAERKFSVNNVFKAVNSFTAETAVAVDDVLPLYDTSATTADKATVQNVLKAINGLTEDTSPDTSADFVLTYDTSATDVKKVKPTNLAGGGMTLLQTLTTTSGATQSVTSIGSTYRELHIEIEGIGHNDTISSNTPRLAVSANNGSSYGTAVTIGANIAHTSVISGVIKVTGLQLSTLTTVFGVGVDPYTNATGGSEYITTVTAKPATSGTINAIRFDWSGAAGFDAGTIRVYGVK